MLIKVIDTETGKILGPNQIGEAWMKCPTSMICYYNNPEKTKAIIDSEGIIKFRFQNPYNNNANIVEKTGWLHSGDLIYYDEEGNFFITERVERIIKYKSYRVSPAKIEAILSSHPGVLEVAVVSKPHEIDHEHPIAFVVKTLDYLVSTHILNINRI